MPIEWVRKAFPIALLLVSLTCWAKETVPAAKGRETPVPIEQEEDPKLTFLEAYLPPNSHLRGRLGTERPPEDQGAKSEGPKRISYLFQVNLPYREVLAFYQAKGVSIRETTPQPLKIPGKRAIPSRNRRQFSGKINPTWSVQVQDQAFYPGKKRWSGRTMITFTEILYPPTPVVYSPKRPVKSVQTIQPAGRPRKKGIPSPTKAKLLPPQGRSAPRSK